MMAEREAVSLELAQRLVDELQRDRRATQFTFRAMNFLLLMSLLFLPEAWKKFDRDLFTSISLVGVNIIWAVNILYLKNRISESISVIAKFGYEMDPGLFRSIIEIREAERFSVFRILDVFEPALWFYLTGTLVLILSLLLNR